jgi:hypothetical protein
MVCGFHDWGHKCNGADPRVPFGHYSEKNARTIFIISEEIN